MLRLGIVSDTHGLLRPHVLERLAGCDRIFHAGDVGKAAILERLEELAPARAVRGNMDAGELARLPATVEEELEDVTLRMTHRRDDVPAAWLAGGPGLVVYGHSHRPELAWRGGVLLLNPGAAGPRRFSLPLTLAVVTVDGKRLVPEILSLER